METYTCECCGKTLESQQTTEECKKEFKDNFPEKDEDLFNIVCDDCYKKIMAYIKQTCQRCGQTFEKGWYELQELNEWHLLEKHLANYVCENCHQTLMKLTKETYYNWKIIKDEWERKKLR